MSMFEPMFRKTKFTLAGCIVDGFKDYLGNHYMDNSQVANLIGKSEQSSRKFWQSKSFKSDRKKQYNTDSESSVQGEQIDRHFPLKVRLTDNHHSLVPTDWVVKYIRHWDRKDNEYAQVLINNLMEQSLDARIDDAFGELDFEKLAAKKDAELALAYERIHHADKYRQLMTICESHGLNIQKINDIVTIHLTGCHTKHFEINHKDNVKMSLPYAKSKLGIKSKNSYTIDDGFTPSMMDYNILKSRNYILQKLINKLYCVKRGTWNYDQVQNWLQAKVKV